MKKFYERIISFLSNLFVNLDEWIANHITPAIQLVQNIKKAVENPLVDIIETVIPSSLPEQARQWIEKFLDIALKVLMDASVINSEPTLPGKIQKLVEYLRQLPTEVQKGLYFRLASIIARASGYTASVKGNSVDLLVQTEYSKLAHGVNADDLAPVPCNCPPVTSAPAAPDEPAKDNTEPDPNNNGLATTKEWVPAVDDTWHLTKSQYRPN